MLNFRSINLRFDFLLKIETSLLSAEKDLLLLRSDQLIVNISSKRFNLMIEDLTNIYVNHCNNLIKYSFI